MTYLILFSPILLLLGSLWVSFAFKYKAVALIIVMFFFENLFFITDLGIGSRFLSDISLALMIPIILLRSKKIFFCIKIKWDNYCWLVIIFIIIVLLSLIISSYLQYGQPLSIGLLPVRKYLLIFSLFFAIALGMDKRDLYLFFRYLAYTGVFVSVLTIIDVILFGGGTIFSQYFAIGQTRGGDIRLHIATFLVAYSIIYSLIIFYESKRSSIKIKYLLMMLICIVNLIFIIQTRAAILGVVITMAWYYFRNININKALIIILIILFIISSSFFIGSEYNFKDSKIGSFVSLSLDEIGSDAGNFSIRENSFEYFYKFTSENSPFWGLGVFSESNFPHNPINIAGEKYLYFLADINGFSTYFNFGIPGVFLLLFVTYKSFRRVISIKFNITSDEPEKILSIVVFYLLLYILVTPTLDNLLVENKLFYTGILFYFLSGYYNLYEKKSYD